MGGKFSNLQLLRGVACLLVVAYHIAVMEAGFGLGQNPLKPLRWFGYAGVDLFFVLSGFIIATTCRRDLGRPAALPGYVARRLGRVYPPYWAALVVAAVSYAFDNPGQLIAGSRSGELVDTLLLLPQSPLPRVMKAAWTLSYEVMFYLAFVGLFLLPRRLAGPALATWAAGVAWAAASGFVAWNRIVALAISPFVLEFLAGCLVAAVPVALSGRVTAGVLIAAALWAGAGSAFLFDADANWLPEHTLQRVCLFGPAATLAVFAAVGRERAGGRWHSPPLVALGDASYSVYLIHGPALISAFDATAWIGWNHTKKLHMAWLVVMFVAGVLPGLVFHRWVERPLLATMRRKKAEPAPCIEVRRAA